MNIHRTYTLSNCLFRKSNAYVCNWFSGIWLKNNFYFRHQTSTCTLECVVIRTKVSSLRIVDSLHKKNDESVCILIYYSLFEYICTCIVNYVWYTKYMQNVHVHVFLFLFIAMTRTNEWNIMIQKFFYTLYARV